MNSSEEHFRQSNDLDEEFQQEVTTSIHSDWKRNFSQSVKHFEEEDEVDQSIEKGKEKKKKTSSVIAIGWERRNIGGGQGKIFISCDDDLTPLKDEKGDDDPRDHKDQRAALGQTPSSRVPLASFIHLQLLASAAAVVLAEHQG